MHKIYIHSTAIIFHPLHHIIGSLAVYDRSKLTEFLLALKHRGDPEVCGRAERATQMFLEFWIAGHDRISIEVDGFRINAYPSQYIERDAFLIELGERPEDLFNDLVHLSSELSRSMHVNGSDAAKRYSDLQEFLKKHPHLPVFKEKA